MSQMTDCDIQVLKQRIAATFTPSAPIDRQALFAGRGKQVDNLLNAVHQKGQHAILFGERGVGKTSLANILKERLQMLPGDEFLIGSTNCEASSTFSSIWETVLREMPYVLKQKRMGFVSETTEHQGSLFDAVGAVGSAESVRYIFQSIKGKKPIIIIDEIDQIKTSDTAKRLADTVKTLSDHAVGATLILVGVADSVDQLISEHSSIERALVQIHMPRMSKVELLEIIDKGLAEVGMQIRPTPREKIGSLSQGLPHYTHLLALHAAQAAANEGLRLIQDSHVTSAIEKSVEQAQESVVKAFVGATTSREGHLYTQVLTACALAKKDEASYFSSSDVREPMSKIMGKPYDIPAYSPHLNDFCKPERGPVLGKIGSPKRYRFRFCNPIMEPYVIMRGIAKGLIPSD